MIAKNTKHAFAIYFFGVIEVCVTKNMNHGTQQQSEDLHSERSGKHPEGIKDRGAEPGKGKGSDANRLERNGEQKKKEAAARQVLARRDRQFLEW